MSKWRKTISATSFRTTFSQLSLCVGYAKPIYLCYAAREVQIETPLKRGIKAVNVFKNVDL